MKGWGNVMEPDLEGRFSEAVAGVRRGQWGSHVIVELGCGRGIYTVALAERLPDVTLVGIDLKGARLWHGANAARERGLSNVTFIRTHIQALPQFFMPGEIDELWITFPDPHPTEGNERRRLTSSRFLELYKPLLKKGGQLHLKTDNERLFRFSRGAFKDAGLKEEEFYEDLHREAPADSLLREVRTQYEEIYLKRGKPIFYVRVSKV